MPTAFPNNNGSKHKNSGAIPEGLRERLAAARENLRAGHSD
jgi:hypothetical protein